MKPVGELRVEEIVSIEDGGQRGITRTNSEENKEESRNK